jgi:hypothetical protein
MGESNHCFLISEEEKNCLAYSQCCGSMTFGVDPDLDLAPAIFVIDLHDANKKQIFIKVFLLVTF